MLELSRTDLKSPDGVLYMRRWVAEIPGVGSLRLHRIAGPDPSRDPHDHPFGFGSFVLRGWYDEHNSPNFRPDRPWRLRRVAGSLAFRRAEHAHWISQVAPSGCWTLVLTGPRRREWGFLTGDGWVDWRTYTGADNGTSQVEHISHAGRATVEGDA